MPTLVLGSPLYSFIVSHEFECESLISGKETSKDLMRAIAALDRPRSGWLEVGVPPEEAETIWQHSKKLSMAAKFFGTALEDSEGVSAEKMMELAIVHDLGEHAVPDFTPRSRISPEEKYKLEKDAVESLVRAIEVDFPQVAERVIDRWLEFEASRTPEAKLVRQLDKLDAVVQSLRYGYLGYDVGEFVPYGRARVTHPRLVEILDTLAADESAHANPYLHYYQMLRADSR